MPGQSYELEDGSSSFKDFHGSRNNRFTSPEQAAKNRIQHPSNVLHFFNGQPDISNEIFTQVGERGGACVKGEGLVYSVLCDVAYSSVPFLYEKERRILTWFYFLPGLRGTGNQGRVERQTFFWKE